MRVLFILVTGLSLFGSAQGQYRASMVGEVINLQDAAHGLELSVAPSAGDVAFEFKVYGQNVLRFPYASLAAYRERATVAGIPFLGPWANRLDEQGFFANGTEYKFNMGIGNVHGALPIHGLVLGTPHWQVVEVKADKHSAWLTTRLDFYRYPPWMAQFPFAHTIEITHRLRDGQLEVHTRIVNLSTEPMPVAIGFHPYLKLTDAPRDQWVVRIGAQSQYLLQANRIPSGEVVPVTQKFPDPAHVELKQYDLDDLFGNLVRDARGRATFAVESKQQSLSVIFGPKYLAAVVFSPDPTKPPRPSSPGAPPQDPNYICLEPMAAITDAMNLNHAGKYPLLQSVTPNGVWEESFWIVPKGF